MTPQPRPERLAGLVLSGLGLITLGTTSPFGLMLCAEKFWEKDRPRDLRRLDAVGLLGSLPGCVFLPFFLANMWNYNLVGPWPVSCYLAFLAGWTAHRVFVWRGQP